MGDGPLGDGQDRRILDQHVAAGLDLRRAVGVELGGHVNEWLGRSLFLGAGRPGTGLLGSRPPARARPWASRWQAGSRLGLGFRGRLESRFGLCLCWRSGLGLGLRGLLVPWADGLSGFASALGCPRWSWRHPGGFRSAGLELASARQDVPTGSGRGPLRRIAGSVRCAGSRLTARPAPRREPGRPSPAPGSGALISNLRPSISTNRTLACSSWNGAVKATRWPSLPGSSVPSRRSRPAMAAAWCVSAGQGLVGRQSGGDHGAELRREAVEPLEPVGGEGKRDSRLRQAAAVATCSFHLSLRWASSFSGSSCSAAAACGTPPRSGPWAPREH